MKTLQDLNAIMEEMRKEVAIRLGKVEDGAKYEKHVLMCGGTGCTSSGSMKIADELEKELKEDLDGVTALTIDMGALEYISSAGLRVLLSAQKIMGKQGEMKVTHVSETIMEIFEVTGFSDILTIE